MARTRKKKSLYEVIGKTHPKSGYGKTLERLSPEKTGEAEPIKTRLLKGVTRWPKRPRIVQFNAARIEISMPYQLAIALLLGIVLLLLVFFRLGQISYLSSHPAAKTPESVQKAAPTPAGNETQTPDTAGKTTLTAEKARPAWLKGNNRIVIQTYELRTHLEPARQYFAANGVQTEIKRIGGMYYLVTTEKYENPERPGTNGHRAKQKIIELGTGYKAPPGYETFGSKPFHDAYGMRFDD